MAQTMTLPMADLPTIYNISFPVGQNMPNVRDDVLLPDVDETGQFHA